MQARHAATTWQGRRCLAGAAQVMAPGWSRPRQARGRPRGRLVLPGRAAFWVTVAMIVLFLYASAAPTPLYGV
jgi:hypothetical protein